MYLHITECEVFTEDIIHDYKLYRQMKNDIKYKTVFRFYYQGKFLEF